MRGTDVSTLAFSAPAHAWSCEPLFARGVLSKASCLELCEPLLARGVPSKDNCLELKLMLERRATPPASLLAPPTPPLAMDRNTAKQGHPGKHHRSQPCLDQNLVT